MIMHFHVFPSYKVSLVKFFYNFLVYAILFPAKWNLFEDYFNPRAYFRSDCVNYSLSICILFYLSLYQSKD